MSNNEEQELLDYEDDEPVVVTDAHIVEKSEVKDSYVSTYSAGFRDFLLKPELLRAIADCGFEHPSIIQNECIPQAIMQTDILGQAKSGMGKTAVFVLATLQQMDNEEELSRAIILCNTRELAFQISKEYERFVKYMPALKIKVFYGGTPLGMDVDYLKKNTPQVIVGTPGRILDLVNKKALSLSNIQYFIVDECDKVMESIPMRSDIQQIFKACPRNKQVMFFSATLTKEIVTVCKKFMNDPLEILIDNDSKLTLHGLKQHYAKVTEKDKNKRLLELLDEINFNQVIIFVKSVQRADALCNLLCDQGFPAVAIHGSLTQPERIKRFEGFKNCDKRILVATNLFGRGIDIERVNLVFNYDMPEDSDTYLHRVARAGRFGTKGVAITFVAEESDVAILNNVQERFVISITDLPSAEEIALFIVET